MLCLGRDRDKDQPSSGDPIEQAAIQYGKAINYCRRDVRVRVAGFLDSYLALKDETGAKFPRIAPDWTVLVLAAQTGRAGAVGGPSVAENRYDAGPAAPLALPRQLIVSGCPGSGKSHFAETSAPPGTEVVRTQFHTESSAASFMGSYRPVPVYEPMDGLEDLAGVPFPRGRPMINHRFVSGPGLRAISTALLHVNRRPKRTPYRRPKGTPFPAFIDPRCCSARSRRRSGGRYRGAALLHTLFLNRQLSLPVSTMSQ